MKTWMIIPIIIIAIIIGFSIGKKTSVSKIKDVTLPNGRKLKFSNEPLINSTEIEAGQCEDGGGVIWVEQNSSGQTFKRCHGGRYNGLRETASI